MASTNALLVVTLLVAGCAQPTPAEGPMRGGEPGPAPVGTSPSPPPPSPTPLPPEPSPSSPPAGGATSCSGPPPGPGYQCVRNCGPPVARAGDPDPGFSWLSPEQAENRKKFGCPICLPDDAKIATPAGDVSISRLAPGSLVWSVTAGGARIARRVEHVLSVQAPAQHRISIVELDDGRRLRASPGHPDANGHPVGDLAVGDALAGGRVLRTSLVPYSGRTFDLVLEGGAAHYFADGVLVRSSLAR